MAERRPLVLVGDSAFAEVACEYFTVDTDYEVVAFAVERPYLKRETLAGMPVVALDELPSRYDPQSHSAFVAITYTQLNRLRARLLLQVRTWGYAPASYVSPRAFVWRNATIGEHCFVFENNVIQPFASIGNNVILWSGNHIGHHAVIEDDCFLTSHVVVSGYARVGKSSFLGVNSAVANNRTLGADNWIGPGVTINRDTPANQMIVQGELAASKVPAARFFRLGA